VPEDKTFYITTPIYYVNGVPHVGSATTTLLCDAIARYHRLRGEPTFFLTGTDEHGSKVAEAAAKSGMTPQALVDENSQKFVDCWRFLNISNDDFIRTSEPRHMAVVAEVFGRLRAQGDIYSAPYEGWYSVADETFLRDAEVKDGRSLETGAEVKRVTEDNYFFRLSSYGEKLQQYIEAQPNFLQPDTRRNEVLAFIKEGLRDVAISRANTGWDIPVPDDDAQSIYVWFDAVINYLTVTGWPDAPKWETIWPADVHLVGKEIYTRFHATLWPAMLLALGLPLPQTVLGHGWWLVRDPQTLALVKGSKSAGNIPTPQQVVEHLISLTGAPQEIAVDALRYYLIRDISFTGDAEFSLENLIARYNDFLANKLGNLLNRSLNMLHQYLEGIVPDGAARTSDGALAVVAREVVQDVEREMLALNPAGALEAIWRLTKAANEDVDTQAPWRRHKEGDTQGVADALYTTLEATRLAAILLQPFLPHSTTLIREQLGLGSQPAENWALETQWGQLPAGIQTQRAQPIFPRIDTKTIKTPTPQEKKHPVTEQPTPTDDTITIADFAKVQLRVAEIKTAERIEGAKKLLRLTVDVGEGEDRQLVAGIAESYAPEDLPGRKIVVVANLQPATIRGVQSQGMLLAATDATGTSAILLTPEKADVMPGARIK
jgi:methionyl-tRNA synthetase